MNSCRLDPAIEERRIGALRQYAPLDAAAEPAFDDVVKLVASIPGATACPVSQSVLLAEGDPVNRIEMPELDGYGATAEVRRIEKASGRRTRS